MSILNAKNYLFTMLFICISFFSFDKKVDCKNFRIGQFTSNYLKHRGVLAVYNRTSDSTQEETATFPNSLSFTTQYKVVWRSDCHYVLYFLSTTLDEDKSTMVKGDSIDVIIQKVISNNKIQITSDFKGWQLTDTLTMLD